jgi:hypothetical protein
MLTARDTRMIPQPNGSTRRHLGRWIAIFALTAIVVFLSLAAFALRPSRIKSMAEEGLEKHLNLEASIDEISVSLLPRPRVSGSGLSLRIPGRPDLPPFIYIESFWMDAGPLSMIRKHVNTVYMYGLRIAVPPSEARKELAQRSGGPNGKQVPGEGNDEQRSKIIIDRLITQDAVLLFVPREPGNDPLTFKIHNLTLSDLGFERKIPFTTKMTNPVPQGLVDASGEIGPWQKDDVAGLPMAGDYVFKDADLSTINGIGGTLQSTGTFSGNLEAIAVTGKAEVPNFSLDLGGKPTTLTTTFDAIVDGTDGTTRLARVDAMMGRTAMKVTGAITNLPGPGRRHVDLAVKIADGRVEDLVALAIDSPTPILIGDVALDARLLLPPGPTRVRQRIQVSGKFGLEDARFTDAQVQSKLQEFSRRSQGKDEDELLLRVLTDLRGQFALAAGKLDLKNLTFRVPGATIALAGGYGLTDESLDFQGTLRMRATVSKAIGGFKSIFIKPFDGLFRKNGAGAVVPIKVTGTREKPKFGVQFGKILKGG